MQWFILSMKWTVALLKNKVDKLTFCQLVVIWAKRIDMASIDLAPLRHKRNMLTSTPHVHCQGFEPRSKEWKLCLFSIRQMNQWNHCSPYSLKWNGDMTGRFLCFQLSFIEFLLHLLLIQPSIPHHLLPDAASFHLLPKRIIYHLLSLEGEAHRKPLIFSERVLVVVIEVHRRQVLRVVLAIYRVTHGV